MPYQYDRDKDLGYLEDEDNADTVLAKLVPPRHPNTGAAQVSPDPIPTSEEELIEERMI
jgi:hypothetical protein